MKGEKLSIFQKGLVIIGIPLIFELALLSSLNLLVAQSSKDASEAQYRQEQTREIDNVFRLCFDELAAVIAYGMAKQESSGQHFDEVMQEISERRKTLKIMCAKDRDSLDRINRADELIDGGLHMLSKIKSQIDHGQKNPLSFMSFMDKQAHLLKLVKQFRKLQHEMNNPNLELEAIAHRAHERDRGLMLLVLLIGLMGNIIVALGVANFFSRSVSSRLSIIADNSRLLSEKKALHEPQNGQDEVALLDHTFHEMTASIAASSAKQKEIMDNSEDVICTVSDNGIIVMINQAAERHWGYSSGEMLEHSLNEFLTEDSAIQLLDYLSKLRTAGRLRPLAAAVKGSSGSLIDVSWSCHWSEIDQCFFCVVHDISLQREHERVKERFIKIMGKQLRSPIERIQDNLQILSKSLASDLNARGNKVLNSSLLSTGRIINLVDELMDLEKMEQGVLQLQFAEVSVKDIIASACASLQSFADKRQIHLETSAVDLKITADGKRAIQVLVNLMSNAVKYSPEGGTVTIKADRDEAGMIFTVSDEGPGIPPQALNSLFARFRRLERDIDKTVSGTGLGLSICKMIVEAHGGQVGAKNNPDKGSCFWFTVPVKEKS